MSLHRINFNDIPWTAPAAGIRFKAFDQDGRRLRLLEFTREFVEADWCRKGHVGIVLEGRMAIDFSGTVEEFASGDGVFIAAGESHKHKARILTDVVKAVLVEDAPAAVSRPLPTLRTDRLVLRQFTLADAPTVQRLAGDREIADTTLSMPHPYVLEDAIDWISGHQQTFDGGKGLTLAITLADGGELIGEIRLVNVSERFKRAELGYWIGKEYWNRDYCTEAAREMVRFGFEQQGLNRIVAQHLSRNLASGRVMQKIGMRHEGTLRQHVLKWDKFEDVEFYGILRSDPYKLS